MGKLITPLLHFLSQLPQLNNTLSKAITATADCYRALKQQQQLLSTRRPVRYTLKHFIFFFI